MKGQNMCRRRQDERGHSKSSRVRVESRWRQEDRGEAWGHPGLNERPLLALELSCYTIQVESGEDESGPEVLTRLQESGCGCHCCMSPRVEGTVGCSSLFDSEGLAFRLCVFNMSCFSVTSE